MKKNKPALLTILISGILLLTACGKQDDGTVGGLLRKSETTLPNNQSSATVQQATEPQEISGYSVSLDDISASIQKNASGTADEQSDLTQETEDYDLSAGSLQETQDVSKERALTSIDTSPLPDPVMEIRNDPQFSQGSIEKENATYREKQMNKIFKFPLCPEDGITVLDVNQNAYLGESDLVLLPLSGEYYEDRSFEWEEYQPDPEYSVAHVRAEYCPWTDDTYNVYFYVRNIDGTIPQMVVVGAQTGDLYYLYLDTSFGSRTG